MSFDLKNLRAFLAVMDHGSVGRAAEACALSQSALSRSIQRLEARVGAPLFDRDTTGMVVTSLGQALEPRARLLVAEGEAALEDLRSVRGLSRGTIRVGAVTSVTKGLLPQALDRVLRERPGLRVEVVESVDDVLKDALIKSEIDLAITTTAAPATDLEMQTLVHAGWRTTMRVVASRTHELAGRDHVTLAALVGQRWAMPPAPALPRSLFDGLFVDAPGGPPPVTAESRSHVATLALVTHGSFLSLMSRPHYQVELAAGLVCELPVSAPDLELQFHVLARRNRSIPPPTQMLLSALRECEFALEPEREIMAARRSPQSAAAR